METIQLPKLFENAFSYPQLDTILMVEKVIEKYSGMYKKKKLWENLPKKVKYQSYKVILDYLQYSKKVTIDKKGKVVWIGYDFDSKLVESGVEV